VKLPISLLYQLLVRDMTQDLALEINAIAQLERQQAWEFNPGQNAYAKRNMKCAAAHRERIERCVGKDRLFGRPQSNHHDNF
jgi:hypothetical protein